MKTALLADIHANLEALENTLIAAEKAGADRFVALGDVVGYGVDAIACLNRLREVDAVCILGNHDQAMVDPVHLHTLNQTARETILRSRETLAQSDLDYLQSFSYRRVESGGVFAHANPLLPEEWEPLILQDQIEWCLDRLDWQLGFIGHTHQAAIHCKTEHQILQLTSARLAIGHHQYLINPGSVGQPRDGDWRAAFALWDVDRHYVELMRTEYPVQKTQEKMEAAGWPRYATERLSRGE